MREFNNNNPVWSALYDFTVDCEILHKGLEYAFTEFAWPQTEENFTVDTQEAEVLFHGCMLCRQAV